MKNTFKYALAVLCLTALALSCQKEQKTIPAEKTGDIHTVSMEFPAMTNPDGTKVSLATTGKTEWEVGDKLVIFGNPSSSDETKRIVHEITSEEIEGHPDKAVMTLDFSGLTPDATNKPTEGKGHDFTVAYPYTGGQYYYGTGEYNYGRARFQDTNQLLMSGYVSDDRNSIVLDPLTAAILFKVPDDFDFDSYVFKGRNGNEVVGYSNLVVEMNSKDAPKYRQKYNNDGTSGPLTSISGSVTSDGLTLNYIYLPVNAYWDGSTYDLDSQRGANIVHLPNGFTILFKKNGVFVKQITATAALEIRPGHMINLGLLPSGKIKDYEAIPASEKASAIELSNPQSANCYVVDGGDDSNANKVFKFPAVKGNTYVYGGAAGTSVGDVASVDFVWETWNNAENVTANSVVKAVDYKDGFVYIKMPSTLHAGNALIAAKDADENILWSWHIWVPASTITQSTYGGLYGTKEIMDRNLGALVATAAEESAVDVRSYGMYYQWGRKDPFVAPATTKNGTMTYNAAKMSVEESIQHPSAYITTGSDSEKDWNTTSSTSLWSATKTEYDPCPPGYVVPTRDKSTVWWGDTPLGLNAEYNTDYKWFKAGVAYDQENPTTTGFLVFPICGYIDQGSLASFGSRAYVWSSYSSSSTLAYQICFNDGSRSREEQRKSRAGNIRCVAQ